jgi:hypothetical protein
MPTHQNLPNMSDSNSIETSPSDPAYNCIGWALHDTSRWWWPLGRPDSYWPDDVPNEVTVEAFVELFSREGFTECETESIEANFEKISLYVRDGAPQHAARQMEDGRWTSKLGPWIDIAHTDPDALEDGTYGQAVMVFRRPTGQGD